jgi:hypothetical protein
MQSTGPMQFDSAEMARHFLARLDFLNFMILEWEIETWTRNGMELNLSFTENISTIKLYGPAENAAPFLELFRAYKGRIEPLSEPLIEFMQKKIGGANQPS